MWHTSRTSHGERLSQKKNPGEMSREKSLLGKISDDRKKNNKWYCKMYFGEKFQKVAFEHT